MGYLHIPNLYKEQDILLFRECYALEKIHGTSAHVSWKAGKIALFSGGAKFDTFVALFDMASLAEKFAVIGAAEVVVFGEAYGGKLQAMSATYGPALKFVAFDVKIGEAWLSVPQAEQIVLQLGLEFVSYIRAATDIDTLNMLRDSDSVQAVRNGMGQGHRQEGVVLRPLIELRKNYGERIIAKHKGDEFKETKTPHDVGEEGAVLSKAREIAEEWATPMRLTHVLDALGGDMGIERTGEVIKAMNEDVAREGVGEYLDNKDVRRAISSRAAMLFKARLRERLGEVPAAISGEQRKEV
jgi:hypothetical protein